jgi:hypothetical protein
MHSMEMEIQCTHWKWRYNALNGNWDTLEIQIQFSYLDIFEMYLIMNKKSVMFLIKSFCMDIRKNRICFIIIFNVYLFWDSKQLTKLSVFCLRKHQSKIN